MPVAEEPEEANQLGSQDETRTLDANQLNKPIKPPSDPSAMSPGPKLMGTPSYMSPEQAESEALDHRTDIFSFGVVMYEALTGKKAFEGKSRQSLLASILKENPKPAPTIKPVTPYLLWQAIDSCLRKERTARTQTAYELYNDLKGVQKDVEAGTVLVDASTIPEPEPVPEPEPISFWQRPALIAMMIVLSLVMGMLATLGL
jgi:serine/threonine protein kinase